MDEHRTRFRFLCELLSMFGQLSLLLNVRVAFVAPLIFDTLTVALIVMVTRR